MAGMQETAGNQSMLSEFQQIKKDIQEIARSQYHTVARIGRIERQLQGMQQIEMPGSTAKDPAPIDSSNG